MKIANTVRKIFLLNGLRNVNEIFRKDVTYGNVKSHKNTGFHPLFRRYSFEKPLERGQIDLVNP